MKRITTTLLLFITLGAFAQSVTKEELENEIKPLNDKIILLQLENAKLKSDNKIIQAKLANASVKLDSLQMQTAANSDSITKTNTELGKRIQQTGKTSQEGISAVDKSLSKNSLYGIIGVLIAILLTGLLFLLLRRRQKADKTDVEQQIQATEKSLSNKGVNIDTQLADILEQQLKLLQEERKINGTKEESKVDHKFPLNVADEITRINAYANTLDQNSQDAKALKSSVKRLTNTLRTIGYEIIDLLGKKYDDGIKMEVLDRIQKSNIPAGEEIISRIIKPLVKYNGEQIQAAQVETSYNN